MLFITFAERVIQRCTDPKSKDYGRITKMTRRVIDGYGITTPSCIIPRKGEIVRFSKGEAYEVVQIVNSKRNCAGLWHDDVIVEVVPYVAEHTFDAGGYSYKEDWPLITDLKADINE